MAIGVVALIFVAGVTVILWLLLNNRARTLVKKIPGPPDLPIIGSAHLFKPNGRDFWIQILEFCEMYKDYGMFKLFLGIQPVVVLIRANTAEILLNSTKHMSKSQEYEPLHPWLGTGLLTSTGQKWKSRRRLLTPTFHFKILTDFLQVFNEQAAIMTQRLGTQVGKGKFDVFPYITLCALDIICETAMGRNVSAQSNADCDYVSAVYKIGEIIQQRQKKPWLWNDFIFDHLAIGKKHTECLSILHGFTNKVIGERRQEFNEYISTPTRSGDNLDEKPSVIGKQKRLAFLDMLLYAARDDPSLTHTGIREEVDTFMFEGHDTTAAAANWAVYLIGAHPEVQRKIQEELDSVLGDDDRPLTPDDLKELKYLECVIKETLRLYPSVPMFARTISEETQIGGYTVPKDTSAVIITSFMHRDPAHFPDPERFDPERWFPENCAGRHPYCYVPFSAGMRNCIGQRFAMMEEKVLLSAILRYYDIESCQTREELKPVGEIILRPEDGIHVKLTKRVK